MSAISTISASYASYTASPRPRPDTAQIADQVFSQIDSKGQGYISASDLESAFSQIGQTSVSGTESSTGNSGGNSSSAIATADDLFKQLDADNDGKVTKDEFSAGLQKLADELDSQFNQSRTTNAIQGQTQTTDEAAMTALTSVAAQNTGNNAGNTTAATSASAADGSTTASSSSAATGATGSVAGGGAGGGSGGAAGGAAVSGSSSTKVYDPADTNEDGKVTQKEEEAYLEKLMSSATASTSSASHHAHSKTHQSSNVGSTDATNSTASPGQNESTASHSQQAALFQKAVQLLQAYSSSATQTGMGISISA